MELGILFTWIVLSLLVGVAGNGRKIGFGMAFLWALLLSPIIGLIIALLSDKAKSESELHIYKQHMEAAKKAEFKGQTDLAINCYMDALYHLKNDYNRLKKSDDSDRQKVITQIENKVEKLKQAEIQ